MVASGATNWYGYYTVTADTSLASAFTWGIRSFILSLRKQNFYFKGDDCFVEIWQQKSRGKQRAIAYIPPHLVQPIMEAEDYIFTTQTGEPYTVNYFGRVFKKIKDAAKIKCEFRLLRHSGGTAFVDAGVENNTISILTGHKNPNTFDKIYKGKSENAAKNAHLKREKKGLFIPT